MIDVRPGDRVTASIRGVNANVVVQFLVNITPDPVLREVDGQSVLVPRKPYTLEIRVTDADGDRTISSTNDDSGNISSKGVITSATARVLSGTTPSQPGELWSELDLRRNGLVIANIAFGYQYGGHPVSYPNADLKGPLDGPGRKGPIAIADDIAPADIQHTLGIANVLRRIHGFIWYYHASSDVASRTLRASARDLGGGLPTGMTSGANTLAQIWPSAAVLTLTQDQEGTIVVNDQVAVSVDNGTPTFEDPSARPNIFPYWARADDVGEFFFDVSAEEAADRHSIYIIEEQWIVI